MMAVLASTRSKDAETQHGCVIVDTHKHIIGTGYNSFARESYYDIYLPNTRPDKYKFMLHSERNALSNLTISPWLYKDGCTAYITGKPCIDCLQALWNTNITSIYYYGDGWKKDEEEEQFHNLFISTHRIIVEKLEQSKEIDSLIELLKGLRI